MNDKAAPLEDWIRTTRRVQLSSQHVRGRMDLNKFVEELRLEIAKVAAKSNAAGLIGSLDALHKAAVAARVVDEVGYLIIRPTIGQPVPLFTIRSMTEPEQSLFRMPDASLRRSQPHWTAMARFIGKPNVLTPLAALMVSAESTTGAGWRPLAEGDFYAALSVLNRFPSWKQSIPPLFEAARTRVNDEVERFPGKPSEAVAGLQGSIEQVLDHAEELLESVVTSLEFQVIEVVARWHLLQALYQNPKRLEPLEGATDKERMDFLQLLTRDVSRNPELVGSDPVELVSDVLFNFKAGRSTDITTLEAMFNRTRTDTPEPGELGL